jgi:TRAP-type mannitol/chloroaromatic compound transport system permease large subunit
MTTLMIEVASVWLFVILAGVPLFAAMGLASLAFVLLSGLPGTIVPQKMSQTMNSFPFVAAPLFIFMGNIMSSARITDRIVRFATAVMGSLRGGYAQASILSSLIFAGMAGSAVADAAGTGPKRRRRSTRRPRPSAPSCRRACPSSSTA